VFIITLLLVLCSYPFRGVIESNINTGYNDENAVLDSAGLQVHFIDVGQGDGIVIEFPDGKTMIVDAGLSGNAPDLIDYIDNNVFENNEDTFDYMLITHSDRDHVGAIDEVLLEYQVNTIFRPKIYAVDSYTPPGEEEILVVESAPQGGIERMTDIYAKAIYYVLNEPDSTMIFSEEGLVINGGSGENAYSITFLSPSEDDYSDVNEFSPIIVLEYRSRRIMLTGDATTDNEQTVVDSYDVSDIDVLKLGHHGSDTSTSAELLAEATPQFAIISVGEDNSYNHPKQETINRLIYAGVDANNIFRTDLNGNIIANVNTQGEVNIFTQVESLPVYIEWEYLAGTIIVAGFMLSFMKSSKSSFI
jgi:competence protein ComEC